MPDTELESQTWIKLTLIAERARREPQCQFISLAHLLDEGFLAGCYYRLGRDRASGVDGVTWREYGEHLEENLRDLVNRMKLKRYKPLPAKRVYIPKDEHSQRALGLPALEDGCKLHFVSCPKHGKQKGGDFARPKAKPL